MPSFCPSINEVSKAKKSNSSRIIELGSEWMSEHHFLFLLTLSPWQPSPDFPHLHRVLSWIWGWSSQVIPQFLSLQELDLSSDWGTCQIILSSAVFRIFQFKKRPRLNLTLYSVILSELALFYLEDACFPLHFIIFKCQINLSPWVSL